jgi:hypothetical protein
VCRIEVSWQTDLLESFPKARKEIVAARVEVDNLDSSSDSLGFEEVGVVELE